MKLKTFKRAFVSVLLACVLVITPSCSSDDGGTSSPDPIDKYIGSYSLGGDLGELAGALGSVKIQLNKVDANTASITLSDIGTVQLKVEGDKLKGTKTIGDKTITITGTLEGKNLNIEQVETSGDSESTVQYVLIKS